VTQKVHESPPQWKKAECWKKATVGSIKIVQAGLNKNEILSQK
jgi:hypothetical protein